MLVSENDAAQTAASAAWVAEPERGSRSMMRLVTWLALKWGRSATRWLIYPISIYFLAFAPRARRASRVFLSRALAREAGVADVLRNFLAFAATLHDRMYLLCGRFENLDLAIEGKLAKGWTLARLDKPMKAILRAGTYELMARPDVPVGATISEYVDVAHAFYERREAGFVNGLLDAIAKEVRPARDG